MKIIGVIPARYKSSRFPGKPLVEICGKPMIYWVYHQAMKVKELNEIYVATDDKRIRAVCEKYDMNVKMTKDTHQTGSDRVAEVAEHTDGDLYINIQGDEPVINPEMIREKEITDPDEIRATSTVKVVTNDTGDAMYFSRSVIPSNIKDGQLARVFRHVGIYAYKKDFLLKFANMEQTELEKGEGIEPLRALQKGYHMRLKETTYTSIGVDLPEHVALVENIIRKNNVSI